MCTPRLRGEVEAYTKSLSLSLSLSFFLSFTRFGAQSVHNQLRPLSRADPGDKGGRTDAWGRIDGPCCVSRVVQIHINFMYVVISNSGDRWFLRCRRLGSLKASPWNDGVRGDGKLWL